jgi:Ion channel
MTTVGYGDVVPKRAAGQVVAILCGCVGLMFMGSVMDLSLCLQCSSVEVAVDLSFFEGLFWNR